MMLSKGGLSLARHPSIRVANNCIRYVTEVRYLELAMKEHMRFQVLLDCIREKLTAVVGKVRRILRNDWSSNRRAVRTVYDGLFVTFAEYGVSIWYEAVVSVVGRCKILTCQRIALLACIPICRTASTDALLVNPLIWRLYVTVSLLMLRWTAASCV